MKDTNIVSMLDHTLLRADASEADIAKHCEEAIHYGFAAVAVNPGNVQLAAEILKGSGIGICAAVGFPLGANCISIKVHEAIKAIEDGATDIDMVINIGALKSNKRSIVEDEINQMVQAVNNNAVFKVILENCLLTQEEKIWVCECAKRCGAQFVKTSTGFQKGGATVADVSLMKSIVGDALEVKASGQIVNLEVAEQMLKAGATRLGTSASVTIAQDFLKREQ